LTFDGELAPALAWKLLNFYHILQCGGFEVPISSRQSRAGTSNP
jgi:hypothetical protein